MNVLVKFGTACGSHNSNRVARLSDAVGAGETPYWQGSYTYDGLGNRTQVVENGTTTTYQYDGENQLTTVQDGTGLVLASYTYDTHHNRTSQTTGSGTTSYGYDSVAGVELTSRTDPSGKVTTYAYDTSGNLTTATDDPAGADQVTRYGYDATGRVNNISQPNGTTISFTYDGDGNRLSKTSTTSGGSTTAVNDMYQLGHVAYETDGNGVVLASFSYDSQGVPTSVRVGSDPTTAPVYYYVYTGHGDTLALTDASGTVVASYSYDAWGVVTSDTEAFSNGWHNPYLYDGRDGARYDSETGLYWLAVRAYDPTLGRFISRDPLGRAPLFGWSDQPYVYAGNNPLVNVDPSGQRFATEGAAQTRAAVSHHKQVVARIYAQRGKPHKVTLPAKPQPTRQSGAPMSNPAEFFNMCIAASSHPSWCTRYLIYTYGFATPNWGAAFSADYYWFMASAGPWYLGVQAMWFYIPATKRWLMSVGGSVGFAVGIPTGPFIGEAGFGLLLTKGMPTSSQIATFLLRGTFAGTETIVLGLSMVGNPGNGWAFQGQVANGFDFSIGGSWTWEPGPPPTYCPAPLPPLQPPGMPPCEA